MKGITIFFMLVAITTIYVVSNFSDEEYSDEEEVQTQNYVEDTQRPEQASMGNYSEIDICKAANSSMFFRDPSAMNVSKAGGEVYKVSYRRPSDNTLWETKCRIEGNRVHWGNFDGRWRTHEMDSVILFMAFDDELTIRENHNDGSRSATHFTKQDDGSIAKVDD